MKRAAAISVALLALTLSGCASDLMMARPDQQAKAVPGGKSQIVLMRSSFVGSAIQASVFDVTSGTPEFLGIISNSTKISRIVDPGERVFMVVSESADFMRASMSPGKTYYALVTPRMGAFRARFSFHPIRQTSGDAYNLGSKDFSGWVSGTKFVDTTPQAMQWFESNKDDIAKKRNTYWPEWQAKPAADRAAQTLNAGDGK